MRKVVFWLLYKIVQVYAIKRFRFFVKKSLEAERVQYPLPHNLVCKVSSLLHGDGTDDRVESVSENDVNAR